MRSTRRLRMVIPAAALALVTLGWPAAAQAHPQTHPQAHPPACRAPEPPPAGTPLTVDPSSLTAGTGTARPASPADQQLVRDALTNLATCVNSDNTRAAPLFSPHFLRDFMHATDYQRAVAILGGLRMDRVRIGQVLAYPGGGWSADSDYLAYGHQVRHERTFLWRDPATGFLLVNGLQALPARPFPGARDVRVEVGEYFFHLDRPRVCAPDGRIRLLLRVVGQERHEAVLLALPPGATAAGLLRGTVPWTQAVTIAQDNGATEIPLVGMRPGVYTLADFIAAPDGVPHVLKGQEATLTVLPPSDPACAPGVAAG